jgi:virulence-associated protein VagC
MTERKVASNQHKKPVLDRLRLPDEYYQPGDTAEVVFEGAVGTIRPKSHEVADVLLKQYAEDFRDFTETMPGPAMTGHVPTEIEAAYRSWCAKTGRTP